MYLSGLINSMVLLTEIGEMLNKTDEEQMAKYTCWKIDETESTGKKLDHRNWDLSNSSSQLKVLLPQPQIINFRSTNEGIKINTDC